ncbi:MAG TPA: imidazolonepropionase, partial [Actinomycetota bacterium]|nr:imidazolonepropionase [Actinomycetota bacterium]
AAALVTASGPLPLRGAAATAAPVPNAGLAWDDEGTIVYVGPAADLPWSARVGSPETGCIAPGFVDCHVHLPFVGWRADEFEARSRGVSYRELHGEDGGIFRSSRMLAEASDDEVLAFCQPLVAEMAAHGTIAMELKTGYGLSVEAELRQARLARLLADRAPQTCTVTLLACHAVPQGWDRADWVRAACEELIPQAAAERVAEAVDVYVEDIAFSLTDLSRVAEAAEAAGLPLRVHADQLGASGAAEAAVALGARSADHLNHVSDEGVKALGAADATVALLLPASTFVLRAEPPPVAALREAGAAIAIATDFNPGTSPVLSMPEAIGMACTLYGVEPLVALAAVTANPAWVLGLGESHGTLEPGKRADFLLLEEPSFAQVPYRPGHNPVVATFVGGSLVAGRASN